MEKTMNGIKRINKVLVANRGEIAVRIFSTLHQMGITTVAVYSEQDKDSMHVRLADERYLLDGKGLADTYLNIRQMVRIARECHADAVHPGYGFLSENPLFARSVKKAGLLFIGPSEEVIRLMGNKSEARELARKLGIPIIEGATGNDTALAKKAGKIGYPVMVKAARGGGGKGMHIASSPGELQEILESTRREAKSYFGNDEVYIEKYLSEPRHIEIQLLADQKGHVLTLFERECSLQRRHQKIVEEAPAPNLSQSLRTKLIQSARILAEHISYVSAGTVEFLVDGNNFYFLEMNTRIQVEHPVTEMITGLDIVKEQIHIATERSFSMSQNQLSLHGHAIEARIYAEDPGKGFLPSPGKVLFHQIPKGKGLRIDTALDSRGEISGLFDPMISKVIFHANSRETARKKLIQHLKDYVLLGVQTNIYYLIELLGSEDFIKGNTHTGLATKLPENKNVSYGECKIDKHLLAMAFMFANPANDPGMKSTWKQMGFWRLMPVANLMINKEFFQQKYLYHSEKHMSITESEKQIPYRLINRDSHTMRIDVAGNIHKLYYDSVNGEILFQHNGCTATVSPSQHLGRDILREINKNPVLEGESLIKAPMHGTVIKINVKPGDIVNKGDSLLILESMKMENKITATAKAFVKKVHVYRGEMVADNSPLIHLSDKLV